MSDRLVSIDTAKTILQQLPYDVQQAILALWVANHDDLLVHKASDETITGVKTFAAKTNTTEIDVSPLSPSTNALVKLIAAKTWATMSDQAGALSLINQTDGRTPLKIDPAAITGALVILEAAVQLGVDVDLQGHNLLNIANVNIANGLLQLDGNGKIPASLLTIDAMEYKGKWNASTNSPALADGTGSPGDMYRVNVAGTQNLGSGSQTFAVGDLIIANESTVWEKLQATDAVTSVAGLKGDITASALRSALALVVGVNVQAWSAQLDAIAALTNVDDNILQRKSGAWTSRTVAQYLADLVAGGLPYDFSITHSNSTRAVGYGANPMGIRLRRNIVVTEVNYRFNTDDASGSSGVELRKNGVQVTGTAQTLAVGNFTGNGSTVTGLSAAFSAGDVLTLYLSSVGTTPGAGFVADIRAVTA